MGEITSAVEVLRDITEKKNHEKISRQFVEHYRMLFEESPISIWQEDFTETKQELDKLYNNGISDFPSYFAKNPDEKTRVVSKIKVLDVNKISKKLFKASTKQDLLSNIRKIQPSESVDAIIAGLCELYKGRKNFEAEYELKTLNGEYLNLYHTWTLTEGSENTWNNVLISRIDVTNLRKTQEFLNDILHSVDEGIIVIDRKLNILIANDAYLRGLGKTGQIVVGCKCYEVSHGENKPCFENGEDCPVQKTFDTGKSHMSTHEHSHGDGEKCIYQIKSYPMRDENGEVISVIETVLDITENKKFEEELARTQKLESIGLLAGGIAHDFNNLLTGILGYISLIKMKTSGEVKKYVEEAEKGIEQAKSLTKQLLTFSKGGEPVKKPIHLQTTVKEAIGLGLSGKNVQYKIVVDDNLPAVDADEGQIRQVVQNIAINAAESMPQGGVVHVNLYKVHVAEDTANLKKGYYLFIGIKDIGIGVPKKHLQSIFDPYFTTKQKGSGLGLATSFSIVKKHGGVIEVESEIGQGSYFKIYLPASSMPVEYSRVDFNTVRGHGKILVLEDEKVVIRVCKELLNMLGYEADIVETGEEAIKKYEAAMTSKSPYDIVILDLTIRGGMGGKEAISKLKTMDPNVKGIVSSGYAEDPVVANFLQYGFVARLPKPYNIEEMSKTLQRLFLIR